MPAAVNETVELAKTVGQGYYGRMINAVLRQIAADPDLPDTPTLRYSVPQPLLAMWQKTYGADATAAFLPYINGRAPLFLVPNSLFVTPGQLQEMLANEGVQARLLPENVLTVDDGFDVERSAAFQKGYFHVQDLSCYLACAALQVRPGLTVLDVCAAPGGKSIHIAELLNGTGHVEARDLTEYKVDLLRDNIERSGLTNIEAVCQDATVYDPDKKKSADIVIADLPCSGLGVLGKKPDLRYKMNEKTEADLVELQRKILSVVKDYVKPDGKLLYSTCTIHREENEGNVEWFLKEYPEFELVKDKQMIPGKDAGDGFYIAIIKRVNHE